MVIFNVYYTHEQNLTNHKTFIYKTLAVYAPKLSPSNQLDVTVKPKIVWMFNPLSIAAFLDKF